MSWIDAPYGRDGHRSVWTGQEMIVWGGTGFDYFVVFDDGARYDPDSNTWTPIPTNGAPIGRAYHAQVWTGSRMIVWGGYTQVSSGFQLTNTGGVLDPTTGTWSTLPTEGAPSARTPHAWAWTGRELLVWGGQADLNYLNSGALFSPLTASWTPITPTGAPAPSEQPSCDWTGTELLVWGGEAAVSGRFNAALDSWSPISVTGAPNPISRVSHTFAGTQLFVWGSNTTRDGGLYCAPPPPRIEVRPAPVDFGRVPYGATTTVPVSITNRGGEYLVLGSLSQPAAPFAVVNDTCTGQSLPHGVSCSFTTSFAPPATGPYGSSIDTTSNDPATPMTTIGLTGDGVETNLEPFGATFVDADSNGVVEPGEVIEFAPSWRNVGPRSATAVTGILSTASGATPSDATASYATIAPGATAGCDDDCYQFQVGTERPSSHWDLRLEETLSTGEIHIWTLHVGDSFDDVPRSHWAYRFVETIFHNRVTAGCNSEPLRYCPNSPLTRAQMAVLLLMAKHGANFMPPPATGTVFTDVPSYFWAATFIEQLAAEGITAGCGAGLFCPNDPITRAEMAVFLLVAEHGSDYIPPLSTGTVFTDVPIDHWAGDFIEQLAAEGITSGCAPLRYCPDGAVTRAEMAVFLSLTFDLKLKHQGGGTAIKLGHDLLAPSPPATSTIHRCSQTSRRKGP